MDTYVCFCFIWNNTGGISILNNKFLLYGCGKTILAIKEYFDINNIIYELFDDNNLNFDKIDIKRFDYIIKSPGIKFDTLLLNEANKEKINIISDLELFYLLYKEYEYIIITGTNGKTTTSILTYQMLEYLPYFKHSLGGNIGTPLFSLINDNRKKRGIVIEASSFTLHSTSNVKPNVFVITNLAPHHLDYHIKEEEYYYDKTKLIRNMSEFDYLIYNKDCHITSSLISQYLRPIKLCFSCIDEKANIYFNGKSIIYKGEEYIKIDELLRKEKTVIMDMMIAILIAKIYHIPNYHIRKVLRTFNGVRFRLDKIYDKNQIVVFNDSKSTSPVALFVAMESIISNYKEYSKVLIIGGRMIDNDYQKPNMLISEFDKIYLYGESKELLYNRLNHSNMVIYDTLEEVINNIEISKGMILLFSPSCVSYDQFSSFEERGKKFNILIENKLKM